METLLKPHTVEEILKFVTKHKIEAKKTIDSMIIVESPTKANTLTKFLKDSKILVISSKGHIADLPPRAGKFHLGINTETFEPFFKLLPDKVPLVKELRKQAATAKNIYLATDPDREGEAISYHLKNYLGEADNKFFRIEFHEITKKAIDKALENPSEIDMDLVNAQIARRMIDRIIGYRLSAITREKLHSRSAGRVQSVVVKLICDLEKEIKAFIPKDFFTIQVELENQLNLELKKIDDDSSILIHSQKEADEVVKELGDKLILKKINSKEINKKAPTPLITSTLIQRANSLYRFSARRTMIIAQSLYEGVDLGEDKVGLITYMRTDSKRLSAEFMNDAKEYIAKEYGKDYVGEYHAKVAANAQDAHEAIRATHIEYHPTKIKDHLTEEQYKVYDLIYKYSVGANFASAKIAQKTFQFYDVNEKYFFSVSSSIPTFKGFLAFLNEEKVEEDNIPANEKSYLVHDNTKFDFTKLEEGKTYLINKVFSEHHQTKPPSRFTEAKLIKYLEEKGIGRPSTYAEIINKTKKSSYVEVVNNSFIPTIRGEFVNERLANLFTDIINEDFTANMEKELDEISEGKIEYKDWTKKFFNHIEPKVEHVLKTMPREKGIPLGRPCPSCSSGSLNIIAGPFGDFVGCSNYPECKYHEALHTFVSTSLHRNCPECGNDLITKYNAKRKSVFVGCSNYPKCKHAEPMAKDEQKKYLNSPEDSDQATSEMSLSEETKEYVINHD